MKSFHLFILIASIAAVLTAQARGQYTIQAESGGQSSLNVHPGDSFSLDVVMSNPSPPAHLDSATFTVTFDKSNLGYAGHTWSPMFPAFPGADDSTPPTSAITASTYVAPANDPNLIDLYFDSFSSSSTFTTGTLVTLSLSVPMNFSLSTVHIQVVPDEFYSGATQISTQSGSAFTLNIVPEPGVTGLLLIGAAGLLGRRLQHIRHGQLQRGRLWRSQAK